MTLNHSSSEIFIPDGAAMDSAFQRITHLGIGAHQDDLEFMAFYGILSCISSKNHWFGGVTCTDGAGSARSGRYATCSDLQMMEILRGHDRLAVELNRVFDSQISGGKRYDVAALARRAANATFFDSHSTDAASQVIFGMDLTPLVLDESKNIASYVCDFIDRLKHDVRRKITS